MKNFKSIFIFLTITLLLFSFSTTETKAAAGILEQIPYTGSLKTVAGDNAADGNYTMTFSLYTVSSGGVAVWTETHDPVALSNGIFSLMLGDTSSLAGFDFNADTYYLGISVAGGSEMSPRQRIGASAYAFNADKVDGASAGTAANEVLKLGSSGQISISSYVEGVSYLSLSPGATPGTPADGQLYYSTADSTMYARINGSWVDLDSSGGATNSISQGDTSVTVTDTGADGTVIINNDGAETLRIKNNGNVGIGGIDPGTVLDVDGNARVTNLLLGQADLGGGYATITANTGDTGISIQPSGDTEILLKGAGGNIITSIYDGSDGGGGTPRMAVYGNGFTNGTNDIFNIYGSNGNRFFSISELTDDGFSYLNFYDGSGTIPLLSIDGEEGNVYLGYETIDQNNYANGAPYISVSGFEKQGLTFGANSFFQKPAPRIISPKAAVDAFGEAPVNRYGLSIGANKNIALGVTAEDKVFVGMPDDSSTTNRFEVNWQGYSDISYTGFAGISNQWFQLMNIGGIYTGTTDAVYEIEVTSVGGTNQFRWRKNAGVWSGNIAMPPWNSLGLIDSGIKLGFGGSTSGELQVGDKWTFTAYANVKPLEIRENQMILNGTGGGAINFNTDTDGWNYIYSQGGGASSWLLGDNDDFGGNYAGNGVVLGTLSNHGLGLGTNNTVRMSITNGGEVYLGSNTQSETKLAINSNDFPHVVFQHSGTDFGYVGDWDEGGDFNVVSLPGSADGLELMTGAAAPIKFSINYVEKMRLNTSGELEMSESCMILTSPDASQSRCCVDNSDNFTCTGL